MTKTDGCSPGMKRAVLEYAFSNPDHEDAIVEEHLLECEDCLRLAEEVQAELNFGKPVEALMKKFGFDSVVSKRKDPFLQFVPGTSTDLGKGKKKD